MTYKCREGFFFEEDYDMQSFQLTCLTSGNFTDPEPWKRCLNPSSKLCLSSLEFLLGLIQESHDLF